MVGSARRLTDQPIRQPTGSQTLPFRQRRSEFRFINPTF